MVKSLILTSVLIVCLASCSNGQTLPIFGDRLNPAVETPLSGQRVFPGEVQIRGVLQAQKSAWNRGDIDAFMEGYWKSDELRFASGGNVTRGWQATIERYRRVYPDRSAMGQLEFSDLEVNVTSEDSAMVHGRWSLQRANDTPGGLFTLGFRKFEENWLIISDTTTSGSEG